jgi:putative phosphoesterase
MSFAGDAGYNIWVISDTHLKSGDHLPAHFIDRVSREDIIIHLGDFISIEVVDFLRSLARLEAVSGNCDSPAIRNLFPSRKVIRPDNLEIGLIHGRGGIAETLSSVAREFVGKVDIALFGHTHMPHHSRSGRTVLFNPGSLTGERGVAGSYGLIRSDGENVWGELFEV